MNERHKPEYIQKLKAAYAVVAADLGITAEALERLLDELWHDDVQDFELPEIVRRARK